MSDEVDVESKLLCHTQVMAPDTPWRGDNALLHHERGPPDFTYRNCISCKCTTPARWSLD